MLCLSACGASPPRESDTERRTVVTGSTCWDSGRVCEYDTALDTAARRPAARELSTGCTCRGTGGSFGAWLFLPALGLPLSRRRASNRRV